MPTADPAITPVVFSARAEATGRMPAYYLR
jgi:hypothetical protein